MIMHEDKLYVYKDETATRAQKILILTDYCRSITQTLTMKKNMA